MVAAMDEDRERQALVAAGYTGTRGALVLAAVLAVVGAVFGSVVFAILLLFLVPGLSEPLSTAFGAIIGAVLGAGLALFKVRKGNAEAYELVADKEWKRYLRREHGL